jgi:hypothetical protein
LIVTMEEHHEAYFAWKQAGVRGAWCWHVDAHLDVGRDGLSPAVLERLAACRSLEEAQSRGLCGNAYVPWGGLHCGNYLYPAISEGIVTRLTWVLPPYLPQGKLLGWAQEHLDGWLDLTVEERAGLADKGGYLEGTLLGIPLQVGTWGSLPAPTEPVLLDIDVDFYLTQQGEAWAQPAEFPLPESALTTLAFSVVGGYTPTAQRALAEFFGVETAGAAAAALDEAAALVRLKRYEEATQALLPLRGEHCVEAGYLLGTCYHHLQRTPDALAVFRALSETLQGDAQAYVQGLCAEQLLLLQRPAEALEFALAAHKQAPQDYRYLWAAALALEELGQLRQATQMLRRGLQLAGRYVFGLAMRLALARLYKKQGKTALARMEMETLERLDLTGQLRPLTLLR